MDKTPLRLIQHASVWAALGLLYGCDAFSDPALAMAGHTFSVRPVGMGLETIGGRGLPEAAAQRMRAENRYGLVIVVPKDRKKAESLGAILEQAMRATERLSTLMPEQNGMTYRSNMIWLATLSEFVVSCVPEWKGYDAPGTRALLVNPQGEIVGSTPLRLVGTESLVSELHQLCSNELFVAEQVAKLDADAIDRFEHYLKEGDVVAPGLYGPKRDEALARWSALVKECLPAISPLLRETDESVLYRLADAFRTLHLDGGTEHQTSTPVIHGVQWDYEPYDSCPVCGMASLHPERRHFDKFLDE